MVELEEIKEPLHQPTGSDGNQTDQNGSRSAATSSQPGSSAAEARDDPAVKLRNPVSQADSDPPEGSAYARAKAGTSDEAVRSTSSHSDETFQDAEEKAFSADKDAAPTEPAQEGVAGADEEERFEDSMTEEDLRKVALAEAEAVKSRGNTAYSKREYAEAIELYSAALELCPVHDDSAELRSVCHANKAMCFICVENYSEAVKSCTSALELNPGYVKALLRRSQAHEKLDKLEEALADAQKVVELDSTNSTALLAVRKLKPIVEERREKLKEEMLGKLKDLGSSLLGNFGMSLDNFKAVKDPATGSYSISYQN